MITVRYFARLREQAGIDVELLDLSEVTMSRIYQALRACHPQLEADVSSIRPARNQEVSPWEQVVSSGDEVAFLPAVSGGRE